MQLLAKLIWDISHLPESGIYQVSEIVCGNNKMHFTRREVLSVTFATILPCEARSAHAKDVALVQQQSSPTAKRHVDHTLLGYASAYELRDKPEDQARTLRVLGHIARQQLDVSSGRKTVEEAATEIRSVIEREQANDPHTFASLWNVLQPNSSDTTEVNLAVAMLRGVVGTGVAYGGLAFAPGPAAVLAGLGLLADGAISEYGPDVLRGVLPKPTDDQVMGLTAWAVKRMQDIAIESPHALELAANLHDSGHFPVNVRRKATEAVSALPPQMRKVARTHLEARPNTPPSEMAGSLRQEVMEELKKLDRKAAEIQRIVQQERNAAIRAIREAEIQRQAQYLAQEITALGVVSNIVLSDLLGQPDVGRKVSVLVQSAVSIYLAIATPGIGPISLVAAVLTGASNIARVFGEESDPLVEALKPVYSKLSYIIERVDAIYYNQRLLLSVLQRIYEDLLANRMLITNLQSQVSALARSNVEGAVAIERTNFDDARNQVSRLLTNNPLGRIQAESVLREAYENRITSFYTFTVTTARSVNATANYDAMRSESELVEDSRARGRADRLVGWLPEIASSLGLGVTTTPDVLRKPVNPTHWAEGVSALLENRVRAADIPFTSETEMLQHCWRDGAYLRDMIILVTSPDAIAAAGQKLREWAGLPPRGPLLTVAGLESAPTLVGAIYRAAKAYDVATVRRTTKKVYAGNKGRYWSYNISHNYEPDFFQELLDANIVAREEQTDSKFGGGFKNYLIRVKTDGPWKDKLLVPDRVTMGTRHYYYPTDNDGDNNPDALQEASKRVAIAHMYRLKVVNEMPGMIADNLATQGFTSFDYWGEVLRLLGTLVAWRYASGIMTENTLLSNCYGAFSKGEVIHAIKAKLIHRLSTEGDWPVELAKEFDAHIQESIDAIRTRSAMLASSKSLPELDENLRRLAGYMLHRGIEIPLSKQST